MNSNIDEAVNCIISLYRRSAKYMQVVTSKGNNQPLLWDNQCAELKYAKYKFLQEFRKSMFIMTIKHT